MQRASRLDGHHLGEELYARKKKDGNKISILMESPCQADEELCLGEPGHYLREAYTASNRLRFHASPIYSPFLIRVCVALLLELFAYPDAIE